MEALARWPGPSAPKPLAIPQASRAGPLTMIIGVTQWVVACTSPRSNRSSQTAARAARRTGRWSGRQPAITALAATFSTVARPAGRAHGAQHQVGVEPGGEHHGLDALRGGDDDRQPVGAAEGVEVLQGGGLVVGGEEAGAAVTAVMARLAGRRRSGA